MSEVEVEEIKGEVDTVATQAESIIIETEQEFTESAEFLKAVTTAERKVKAHHAPLKKSAHAAWKAVVAAEKDLLAPLEQASKAVKAKRIEYRRKVEAEQRRIQEEARKRAEEEARKKAEEEQLARAEQAEADGMGGLAEEILSEKVEVETPITPTITLEPPKAEGISVRKNWKAEVTDLMALIKAVAEGAAPAHLVKPDTKAIGQLARALKDEMKVPGVRVWCEQTEAVRV